MLLKILIPTVTFLGPLALGMWGTRSSRSVVKNDGTAANLGRGTPWPLVINSALTYALAYNVIFLAQEFFLVIPKAIYGLQPILYHNNHRWLRPDPIEDLLQGSGALAILVIGLIFAGILSRRTKMTGQLKLFSIWMAYQGLVQSLQQVAFVVVNPNGDVADALKYLGVGQALQCLLAIAALAGLVFVGLALTKPLLELAPSPVHVASPRERTRLISQIGTLSALIGVVLIVPFRVPPIDQVEGPVFVFLLPLLWTLANSGRVADAAPAGGSVSRRANWALAVALLGLLAVFRLWLAPGVHFFSAD